MSVSPEIRKIAFIGDYLPRKCGIATFTTDLRNAAAEQYPDIQCFVVPVNDLAGGYEYPHEVRFEIEEQDLPSYQRAADFLNLSNVDVVCVQHEFGIYGGPSGSHLLALLRELKMPVVTTLHTVLREPNAEQRRVMQELASLSSRLVVMTKRGEQFLREIYQIPAARIDLIPHGIPDTPFSDPNFFKDLFDVEGKFVLLTFGLLSPNKGIEHALNALPAIIKEFPNVVYIVLGATHPNLVREHGETYRLSLERLAKKLGVQKNVVFYNRFVDLPELKEFIGAADLYLTPYLNEAQITSGTLAYAFGAGKVVVSTPYWHAAELLADDRGVLVPFGDSAAIAREVLGLLRDETRRHAMRKQAYLLGRDTIWSEVSKRYMQSFQSAREARSVPTKKTLAVKTLDQQPDYIPTPKLDHLLALTDSTGMFQHATHTLPALEHGYCTDDNARALILAVQLEELGEDSSELRRCITTYAAFLNHALPPGGDRFRNFMTFDRRWVEAEGSEDSHGRALWALGTCVARSRDRALQQFANGLFERTLAVVMQFTSPRAWAFALLGIHEYLRRFSGDRHVTQIRDHLTGELMRLFRAVSADEWVWFEDILAYDNAKLPQALLLSGRSSNNPEVFEVGLKSLRWLAELQTAETGYFRPIGSNGFYRRGGERARFDQQPVEAHAMLSACLEAYRCTSDRYWFDQARLAFDWFLGRNDLGLAVYDSQTGGCRDALHVDRVNQNEGAESTLSFLLSLTELQLLQNTLSAFQQPVAI